MYLGNSFCYVCCDYRDYDIVYRNMSVKVAGHEVNILGKVAICPKCGHTMHNIDLDGYNYMIAKHKYGVA